MPASKSRPQYGFIDTSNSNIRPLVTILWQIYISVPKRNIRYVLLFYMLASISTPQYSSLDTSNTNICSLVIILWQNKLKQQYVALNPSLLPYLMEIFIARHTADIYHTAVGLEKM